MTVSPAPSPESPDPRPGNGLRISLLGPPQTQWQGRSLAIPRRLVRAFLYYLAAQGKPVPRDELCLLFWPDISDAEAHRNLTRLLVHLRRALPIPEALVSEAGLIYLAAETFECDVHEFRRLAAGQPERAEALEEALTLYRAPFLSGFYLPNRPEFEGWASRERTALEQLYLDALASLMEIHTARQDYSRAIQHARRYLETDELAEGVHRQLISLYALTGDRAHALRQFQDCTAILERELGTGPLQETVALYQTVRDGKLPRLPVDRLEGVQPAGWTRLRLDVPLLGRASTLERLTAAYQRARAGQSSVVLISGEPGIGKSRLLHDFAARCWSDSLVLFGSGQPGTQSVPYHPIVEALRAQSVAVPASFPPLWQAEVARLVPELNGLVPNLPRPLLFKEEEARVRLFEGLCRFVFALQAETSPVLFCFDDLHWFDSTSLSWLTYLCREFLGKSSRVLILGTYRLEEADKISGFRDSLGRFGLLEELQLQGLDGAHVRELLEYTSGDVLGNGKLASRLREATGGNPFFLIEILRALGEERPVEDLARLADLPLPESVREVISLRLARLDLRSRQVLEAGAVLGSNFGFHGVRLTAGRSDLETAAGLDELVGRQLLLEEAEGYRFSHDLVRRATGEATGPVRLRLLHGRAGKALEKLGHARPAALAGHFDQGGDWQKACHYYLLSASAAEALFAWQESEAHLQRALELLAQIDPDCTRPDRLAQRGEVLGRLARLHALQGRPAERDADLKQLDELVQLCQDPKLRLRSIVLQSHYLHVDGRYAEGVETAERGVTLAEELKDNEARLRLLAQAGQGYAYLGQPERALALLEEARAIEDQSISLNLRARVMTALTMLHIHLGDYQQALGYQKEAVAYLQKLGDHVGAAQWQIEGGFLCTHLGRFLEARQTLTEVLAFFRKLGTSPDEAHALLALGGTYAFEGDYPAAIRCYSEALELQQHLRNPHLSAAAEAGLGLDYYHLGDLAQSRAWLARGLERARSIGHRMRVAEVLVEFAMLEFRAGDLPAAWAALQEGLTIARETHSQDLLAAGLAVAAGMEREAGAPARALDLAEEAVRVAQPLGQASYEMWGRTEAGLAHLSLGELEQAEAELRQAVLLVARAHQARIGTERVHLAYAKALERSGKLEQAQEQRRLAEAVIQAKAARIQDPVQRRVFLEMYEDPIA